MTLVRHAQIDFGVRIDSRLNDLRPDGEDQIRPDPRRVHRVHYPDGAIGLLLYIKLSVTGNESELIRRYRTIHPDFPPEHARPVLRRGAVRGLSQLGVHAADGLFSRALMSNSNPTSVPHWFRQLAANLLMPGAPDTADA